MTPGEWDALYARLESGAATYEDAAAMWANTFVGKRSGVSPEEFIERLRAKYPTPEVLGEFLKQLIAMLPSEVRPSHASQRRH